MACSADKQQQVILFFLERINNVHFGRTKSRKLLYYVNFDHFEMHGRPVSGATYRKLPYPVRPKPILLIIKAMLDDKNDCVRRLREGHEFFKTMARRRSDLEAAKAATA